MFGSAPGSQRGLLVTPGTYGQLRSASGHIEAHLFFSYGGRAPTAPVLPAKLPGAGLASTTDHFFDASSTGADAVSYRVLAKPLADGSGVIVVAVPLSDLDSTLGRLLFIELVVSALLLVGLGIVGKLGTAFNTMVDEIEVAFAERAASEERLRRFLADASHELRTPLTSILGYAELFDLGVRDRPEDLAVSLRTIKAEAARMGTLVDDLLLLARTVTVSADRPVVVPGDEDRLRQVVDNLVVNAVIHTPAGTAVGIAVREEGDAAVLRVHDDGPGIDPAEVGRIFQPFYRPDPSRARASGGAGLGLAIVAAIVGSHGGTVGVESGSGEGTTFEVRLPAGPRDQPSAGGGVRVPVDDQPVTVRPG